MSKERPRLVIMAERRLLKSLPTLLIEFIVPDSGMGWVGAMSLAVLLALAVLIALVDVLALDLAALAAVGRESLDTTDPFSGSFGGMVSEGDDVRIDDWRGGKEDCSPMITL
jgi:hypothetical protein